MAVFILEDDPGVSDSLEIILEQLGHDVVVYSNAEQFFMQEPPCEDDTVIVDLGLPGINGSDAIRWINRLSSKPRVIAISGQSRTLIERQFAGKEVPIVLRKPLSEEQILRWLA